MEILTNTWLKQEKTEPRGYPLSALLMEYLGRERRHIWEVEGALAALLKLPSEV